MKRALVLAEWRRAGSALRAAEILTREGCYPDAVSRSYYSVFHAAKAALYVQDIVAETHQGVRRMFGLHLIKTGVIEPEWASHLGEPSTSAWPQTTTRKRPFQPTTPALPSSKRVTSTAAFALTS